MFNLGPMEMLIVMGIAVLLFGKRLPEVGRSLGKGIVEFKKGLSGVGDEFDISGTGPGIRRRAMVRPGVPKTGRRASRAMPRRPFPSLSCRQRRRRQSP